jgi:hypothetical protein
MQRDARHTNDRSRPTLRGGRAASFAAAATAAGVLVAGCGGGGSPSGSVASLGSARTPSTSSASSPATGSPEGHEAAPGSQAVAFVACMRSHGVPNFPDPQISQHGSEGSVKIAVPASVGSTPGFHHAQEACRKLLPNGGTPNNGSPIGPAQQAQYLKAAACIRAHGVANFPDPTFTSGGVHINQHGLNLNSQTFKSAVGACESLIPGGVHDDTRTGSTQEAAP